MLVCGSLFGSGWYKLESEASCALPRIGPVWDYTKRAATVHAFSKHTPANATLSALCVYRAAYSSSVTKPCITWKCSLINQRWDALVHSLVWNQLRNWLKSVLRRGCMLSLCLPMYVKTHLCLTAYLLWNCFIGVTERAGPQQNLSNIKQVADKIRRILSILKAGKLLCYSSQNTEIA